MTWTKVDADVALEVASHEAIIRQAYKDSVGVWTWSVGLTSATGHDVTRYIGKPQTMEHCLAIYAWALDRYADAVRKEFKGHELTKAQFASALSFHWNTGSIHKASWVKKWKAGDVAGARKAIMNWTKAGGKTVKGLVDRRTKERNLFFDGKWSNDGKITEYERISTRSTPVWGSAVRRDVRDALNSALGSVPVIKPEIPSVPIPAPPDIPKSKPAPQPAPSGGFFKRLLGAVVFIAIIAAVVYFKFIQ